MVKCDRCTEMIQTVKTNLQRLSGGLAHGWGGKPRIVSRTKVFLGSKYGGWWVHPDTLNSDSIAYSFGIGTDISFDLEIINRYGVTVHAFDPTPKSIAWLKQQCFPAQLHVHEYGLADFDGTANFYQPRNPEYVSHSIIQQSNVHAEHTVVPVYQLATIMQLLQHTRIDILKMDIEGAEYSVVANILAHKIEIKQLLIEFHHRFFSAGESRTNHTIETLKAYGYELFAVSETGTDYSFIRGAKA